MDEEKEDFLKRWSRLKREGSEAPEAPALLEVASAAPDTAALPMPPPAPLPAAESLGFSSDFSAYMQAGVDKSLRRAALQKLFQAEHFNVMDGLDVYVDDYNSFEPIGAELLRNLNQARGLLFDDEQAQTKSEPAEPTAGPASDPVAPPPIANIATDKPE